MADWLTEWQTLVGSVIGGIMALVVALVVSRAGRWREFTSAASHVSLEFGKYCAKMASMRASFPPGTMLTGANLPSTMSIVRLRPRLSALFGVSEAKILSVDETLAGHLATASMFSDFAEREFEETYQLHLQEQSLETIQEALDNAFAFAEESYKAMSRCDPRIDALTHSWFPSRLLLWYRFRRFLGKDELKQDEQLRDQWKKALGKGTAHPAIAPPDHHP